MGRLAFSEVFLFVQNCYPAMPSSSLFSTPVWCVCVCVYVYEYVGDPAELKWVHLLNFDLI